MTKAVDKKALAAKILIVDDEASVRDILSDFLQFEGYNVHLADGGKQGLESLLSQPFDIVLTDLEMPEMNGLDLLREMQLLKNPPPAVMMTGYGTVETAIEAMKQGAYDYILKPFQIEELSHLIRKTLEHHRLAAENIRLQEMVSLYSVSERLNAADTEESIAQILIDSASVELEPDCFCYWRLVEGQWRSIIAQIEHGDASQLTDFVDSFDSLSLLKAFHQDEPVLLSPDNLADFFHKPLKTVHSAIMVPTRVKGRVSGMILAVTLDPSRSFTEGNRRSLQLYADRAALCIENVRLLDHLEQTFMQTIQGLVGALEAKDEYTKGHSERVMQWALIVADQYGLGEQAHKDLQRAGLLHDIGKIGLNLDALNRPGKLTEAEVERFKLHTVIGKRILEPVEFLSGSLPAITHHHERWDGTGYPLGLAGREIPLGARVLAIADSFEVMITDRVYRAALSLDEAKAELRRSAGSHFDPEIVDSFLEWLEPYDNHDQLPIKGGRRDSEKEDNESQPNVA